MKSRAATAIRAGVGAVALALAVSTAAPASAQAPAVVEQSVGAHTKSAPKVFRSVKVSPAQPVVGSKVKLTGRVKGAKRRVVLQLRSDRGVWRKVAVTRTRKGKFSFTYAVESTTPRSLRVVARTAPKVKSNARHLGRDKGSKRTHRKLKSRRVVSRVVAVRPRPAPVVPPRVETPGPVVPPVEVPAPATPGPVETPAPDPDEVFAAEVRAAVDAGVRAYRDASNATDPVGTNECLSQWADGFAAEMAESNIFAHSVSSEWNDFGVVSSSEACPGQAPAHTQEAIDWEEGATPQEVADKVLQAWKDAWMHDEVLLDDFGSDRVLSVGVAKGDATHGWYVVAVFGFNS
ncbi:CAP domain-containing protein [Nocardioides gilvus]|uniref:CAP domain-containing protein n=1 Tax=Nocardioides gilvus TaxID=1735589 RepID=UPI0013A5A1EB|nr:CAP domain-containing protein [Nocardioides gilvus]